MFEIEYYETNKGKCPINDFLDTLEPKLRAKTIRTIMLLESNGPLLREPFSKSLSGGVFELRTIQGTDITRIFYFFVVGRTIILTNGFVKKSNSIPMKHFVLALRYKKEYERRIKSEEI